MKRSVAAIAALLVTTTLASSQVAPFDMSPERPPAPAQAPVKAAPPQVPAAQPTPVPAPVSPPRTTPPSEARRYIIPSDKLSLNGETDRKQWTVQLTEEEAQSATTLSLGYQSSVVIAPELSRLKVSINGAQVLDEPVQSSEGIANLTRPLPPGTLRAGANLVTIEANQRHRTDCTVESTYDLWSELAPESTFLSLGTGAPHRVSRPEDVATIGVDAEGKTRFNIIAPGIEISSATEPVIRLAQGLSIYSNMPNHSVRISQQGEGPADSGSLNIVVGLPAEVAKVLSRVPSGATVSPTISFVDDPSTGPGTMVVTGPSWQAVSDAVDTIVSPVDRPITTERTHLSTQAWHYPDAPIFFHAGQQTFSKLGARTEEFAGRRYKTSFVVGIPSDFYARDYGEARVLLDAAYTAEVLPGSHIDIYVNGNIASTLPITNTGGAILRQFPVSVTMRHFRPGANTISVEAVLRTAADETCAPGATGNSASRFVLFDTSVFDMPEFARIAQLPNLSGIAGTGFPYNRSVPRIPVVIEGGGTEALSAAATILSKMSVQAGRLLPIEPVTSLAMIGERDAMFFGPIARLQPEVLSQVGIAPESRVAWGEAAAVAQTTVDPQLTTATFDKWRNELSSAGWRGQVNSFQEWLSRNFDITFDSLRLVPAQVADFTPAPETSLVVAQRPAPDGEHVWTAITAPTPEALSQGAEGLVQTAQWNRVGGEMSLFNAMEQSTAIHEVSTYKFRQTQATTFGNIRLIVANWLSGNILSYAAALFVMCMLLGIATLNLLQNLGRRK